MAKRIPIITSEGFIQWLEKMGIDPMTTYRVIIDARVGEPLKAYVERFGTTSFINFEPPSGLETAIQMALETQRETEEVDNG